MAEMLAVYEPLPAETDPTYKRKRSVRLFYMDKFVPACGGPEYYGDYVRFWYLPVQTVSVHGKERICVTTHDEAFGLVVFDNNHAKYSLLLPEQIKQRTSKMPKFSKGDPRAAQFDSKALAALLKYSNPNAGQSNGWNEDGYKAFNQYKANLTKFRDEDSKNGFKIMDECRKMVKDHNDIFSDAPLLKGKRARRQLAMKEVLVEEEQAKPKRVRANNEEDVIYDTQAAAGRRKSLRSSTTAAPQNN